MMEAKLILGKFFDSAEDARSYFINSFPSGIDQTFFSEIRRYGFENFMKYHGKHFEGWPTGGTIRIVDEYTRTKFFIGYELDVSHFSSCATDIEFCSKMWMDLFKEEPELQNLIIYVVE